MKCGQTRIVVNMTCETHLLERVARAIAGERADQVLGSKNKGKLGWELFIPNAERVR